MSYRPYHGRNALRDVDPSSIQHQMHYQESIEQNDDRIYSGGGGRDPYATSAMPSHPDRHTQPVSTSKQASLVVALDEDDEDGDWC